MNLTSVIFAFKTVWLIDFNYFLDEIEINVNKLNLSCYWHILLIASIIVLI
ncbi:hypothetical protein HYD71_00920 [Mycoplasmopsis bovis]|nr:hypothetical protein [Mycoplasmopsis bovis]QQH49468.1 hypothetical protein HYD71_00920 [Mycoplasmopsis bovis]